MKVIATKNAPAAVGPYSQAIDCGDTVYCSGQIPLDPLTGAVVEGGLEAQAHQMFRNVKAVLAEAGAAMVTIIMALRSSATTRDLFLFIGFFPPFLFCKKVLIKTETADFHASWSLEAQGSACSVQ